MPPNTLAAALRALATGTRGRSQTARLREVFDALEAALAAGVRRTVILEALHAQGFTLTLRALDSAIYRIRKQRARAGQGRARADHHTPAARGTSASGSDAQDAGLDPRERRARLADRFITPETTNPLLQRLKDQDT